MDISQEQAVVFKKDTRGVVVSAHARYLEDKSSVQDENFVWAYYIHIENQSKSTVKLLNRHWRIIDKNGLQQHVHGSGVVGVQPELKPGEDFRYSSIAKLNVSSGIMIGNYDFVTHETDIFPVVIPAFPLDCPHIVEVVH